MCVIFLFFKKKKSFCAPCLSRNRVVCMILPRLTSCIAEFMAMFGLGKYKGKKTFFKENDFLMFGFTKENHK